MALDLVMHCPCLTCEMEANIPLLYSLISCCLHSVEVVHYAQ